MEAKGEKPRPPISGDVPYETMKKMDQGGRSFQETVRDSPVVDGLIDKKHRK